MDGFTPPEVAKWVRWLARKIRLEDNKLWKIDKTGTLKQLWVLEPHEILHTHPNTDHIYIYLL